jgi:hypothetical protein
MTSSSKNVVTDNVVAFNGDAAHNDNGVEVLKSGTATLIGNRIVSNSIFSNQNLGIDLSNSGSGGREQAQRPGHRGKQPAELPRHHRSHEHAQQQARKSFTIQLFSNPSATDEGKTFLGQVRKKTNRQGKASFSFFGPAVPQGDEITATATSPDGTSEFSDPVGVVPAS